MTANPPQTRDTIADILCIGCQKGSTSWLHSVLACHPRVWTFKDHNPITSTDKEAHFWDWNRHRGIAWYRDLMTPPTPDRVTLDFTPDYALLNDEQIAECKALNPTARVIYILRDPLARAVSALRMHLLWDFGKDYDIPLGPGALFEKYRQGARLAAHGDYLRNLRAWQRHYPDLIVLNYEDFHNDRAASVQHIMDRLDLPTEAIQGQARERFDRLMGGRVWASEPFAIERAVLMTLHGMTWATRLACARELDMRFDEGARLLAQSGA